MRIIAWSVQRVQASIVSSRLRGVVRAFLLSLRSEGEQEPLFEAERIEHERAALLRQFPLLREALSVVASEIRREFLASREGQRSRLSSAPVLQKAKQVNSRQTSQSLANSRGSLRSKLRYDGRMKSSPKHSPEYTNFDTTMRQILQVSKTDLNRMLAEEKAANVGKPKRGPKPKTSASDRAVSDKG